MPKRLGYKTDSCMMLIRREINEHMIKEKRNKSKLVNDLLLKWYEHELCHTCLGGVIGTGNCKKCEKLWVRCENVGEDCCDDLSLRCDCGWNDMYGL